MKIFFNFFSLLLCSTISRAQVDEEFHKYFDTSNYYAVDSFFFKKSHKAVYVLYKNEDDESIILYKNKSQLITYSRFLACYSCLGRGAIGSTYGRYMVQGEKIAFIQNYFNGEDTVFVDFSKPTPIIYKIIIHSGVPNERMGPDDGGNFILIPIKDAPITSFSMPVDTDDPIVKEYFLIKPLKRGLKSPK